MAIQGTMVLTAITVPMEILPMGIIPVTVSYTHLSSFPQEFSVARNYIIKLQKEANAHEV